MASKKPSAKEKTLADVLDEIRTKWLSIESRYDGADPDFDALDDDEAWQDLLHRDLTIHPELRRQFPFAYGEVREQAEDLMCMSLAAWAGSLIHLFGMETISAHFPGPRRPKSRRAIYESPVLARNLCGTDDVVEAGRRIILWAAACDSPNEFRREEGHATAFRQWVGQLVVFGGNRCRLLDSPMDWISACFASLNHASDKKHETPIAPLLEPIATPSAATSPLGAAHSPDFRSVSWFGKSYEFTENQAACVKIWWEVWENGATDVGDAYVLDTADISGNRMDAVFRGCDAWKTMIIPGATKGTHRLMPPTGSGA